MKRTLGSLDLFDTLTDRGAVLDLETSLIRLDRLDVAPLTMQRRTLACITLGPCRIHLDTLQARVNRGAISVTDRRHMGHPIADRDTPPQHLRVRHPSRACQPWPRCDLTRGRSCFDRGRVLWRIGQWRHRSLLQRKPCSLQL